MRTFGMLSCAVAVLMMAALDPAWAYHAKVKIKVTNDSETTYDIDLERDGGSSTKVIDGGSYYEWEYSATAYAWDAETYEYDVYVDDYDGDDATHCNTSISVETNWDFGVELDKCTATTPQTTACTVETKKKGTTCKVYLTIND